MKIEDLCLQASNLIYKAKVANHFCSFDEAYEHLRKAYDLLNDVVGSGARDKCESSESSNGENHEL